MKMSCIGSAPRDLYFLSLEDQEYIFNNYEIINRITVEIAQEHIQNKCENEKLLRLRHIYINIEANPFLKGIE